jgi:hypothetical protein
VGKEAPDVCPDRELSAFAAALAVLVAGLLHEALIGGRVLSPADVVFVQESFRGTKGPGYEPANRLLIDPVLQFQPWLEFNRAMLRRGRLPLWNHLAGCGAPHLANGQSAVFDPFHVIAYVGRLPEAHAWMAAARLWTAGLGMFLLARLWGLGPWGRWFAGLSFPLCGFLVAWLLYPVASVAVWMPWLFWTSEHLLRRPGPRTIGATALAVGLVLLGGHVQTSAHVLIATGLYVLWRRGPRLRSPRRGEGGGRRGTGGNAAPSPPTPLPGGERGDRTGGGAGPSPAIPLPGGERGDGSSACEPVPRRAVLGWLAAVGLGVALGAIEVVPLGFYLARSPVWTDRAAARRPVWELTAPRWADAVRTALPYALGSQRRGHPNLARALDGHNLNEAAGGFAGLVTLAWLAPGAWSARRAQPRVRFLAALVAVGAMGAFGVAPVDQLLRAVPVLNVMDNRRLTLWVAFGLVLLGGIGLDQLEAMRRSRRGRSAIVLWGAAAAGLLLAAAAVDRAAPWLRARAIQHYARTVDGDTGSDRAASARARAERQVRQVSGFLPGYLAREAGLLLTLAALATAFRRGQVPPGHARAVLLVLSLLDSLGFGCGLNPAIPRAEDRPDSPVLALLRREAPPPARVVALGAELPPNTLMRYGLADARNYDSVELARSLRWFAPLYEPEPGPEARSSRRRITWAGVLRARERLREAGVAAVVAATPPPAGAFARVARAGTAWIAFLPAAARGDRLAAYGPGTIALELRRPSGGRLVVPETYDPGWRADVDGLAVPVAAHRGTFLEVTVPPGSRRLALRYEPVEVRLAGTITLAALLLIARLLRERSSWRGRKIVAGLGRPRGAGLESEPSTAHLVGPRLGPSSHWSMRR